MNRNNFEISAFIDLKEFVKDNSVDIVNVIADELGGEDLVERIEDETIIRHLVEQIQNGYLSMGEMGTILEAIGVEQIRNHFNLLTPTAKNIEEILDNNEHLVIDQLKNKGFKIFKEV